MDKKELPQDIIDWIKTESKKVVPDLDKGKYTDGTAYQIEQSWINNFREKWVEGAIAMWKRNNS